MPVLCNYYVTYRCNAKCGFCDIWEQPSPLIDVAEAEKNLLDLRRLGVKIVDFTGGEPLLHPQIGSLLELAKRSGFLTTLTTNGLLYPKRARGLAGSVDLLHFSIDSPVAAEHDASRGVACFDQLMESIGLAIELGERPDLLFTVTSSNYHHLDTIYESITRPNGLVLIINPLFEYNGLGGVLSDEAMSAAARAARRPLTYLNPAFLKLRQRGGNQSGDPVCLAASTTVVISPFNELVLPCYHAGMDRLPILDNLYEVWHSDLARWHREMEGRHKVCEGCSINCYFEPSFAVQPQSSYFWQSLPSKARYAWTKFIVQRMQAKFGHQTVTALPASEAPPVGSDGSTIPDDQLHLELPVLR